MSCFSHALCLELPTLPFQLLLQAVVEVVGSGHAHGLRELHRLLSSLHSNRPASSPLATLSFLALQASSLQGSVMIGCRTWVSAWQLPSCNTPSRCQNSNTAQQRFKHPAHSLSQSRAASGNPERRTRYPRKSWPGQRDYELLSALPCKEARPRASSFNRNSNSGGSSGYGWASQPGATITSSLDEACGIGEQSGIISVEG